MRNAPDPIANAFGKVIGAIILLIVLLGVLAPVAVFLLRHMWVWAVR